jgi:hypothetical protein
MRRRRTPAAALRRRRDVSDLPARETPSSGWVSTSGREVDDYAPYGAFFGTFLLITTIVFLVSLAGARLRG